MYMKYIISNIVQGIVFFLFIYFVFTIFNGVTRGIIIVAGTLIFGKVIREITPQTTNKKLNVVSTLCYFLVVFLLLYIFIWRQ